MNLSSSLFNTLWMLSCRQSLRTFHRSVLDVKGAQSRLLLKTIDANLDSAYGNEHDFTKIRHVDDFRSLVPITEYETFEPWIDEICRGRSHILTTEPVRLLEPTSGSVSGRRLIPYTDSLRRQFQNGINPWIADLFSTRPQLRCGRAYWMMTPSITQEETSGGLKIGFADDTQYLGLAGRLASGRVMAIPPRTLERVNPKHAPYQTLLRLLEVPDLTLISIWSPTFLTRLIRLLESSRDQLILDLEKSLNRNHSDRVFSILNSDATWPQKLALLWPRLALISCWADASAAHSLHDIRELFPNVEIQPKGLISTEAFVSLPFTSFDASALSIRSHFFEFQQVASESSHTLLAEELSSGERYRVIVTTGGGLYRYQTHDVIEVVGFLEQCPLIRFCGRGNRTSDLVGEKLNEEFVSTAIDQMAEQLAVSPTFAMLVPRRRPPGYRLLISFSQTLNERPSAKQLTDILESRLSQNPYYEHAVRVGQLAPLTATIDNGRHQKHLWETYEARCLSNGMRQGDIKPTGLETHFEWD